LALFAGCPTPESGDSETKNQSQSNAPLTADISLYETVTDTSHSEFPPNSWTGSGTAAQGVTLNAQESAKVYFAAGKSAAQTISIGGTDGALVTQYTSGTVDGSAAGDTESVFAVDTSAFDLMFEGGSRVFTLNVSEAEKAPITITVTLNTTPELSAGIAVFKVDRGLQEDGVTPVKHDDLPENASPEASEAWARSGRLTRIDGIQNWNLPRTAYNTIGNWQENSMADNLLSAFAWIDHNAEANEEYLIRVQKDEEIPCIYFGGNGKDNIKYRLRGIGAERSIKHENRFTTGSTPKPYVYKHTNYGIDSIIMMALFRTGRFATSGSSQSNRNPPVVLSLEDKITIQGNFVPSTNFRYLIYLTGDCALIMEKGSKITGFDGSTQSSASFIYSTYDATNNTRFFMRGGTITGNTTRGPSVVYFNSPNNGWKFIKTGGSITGNTSYTGESSDAVYYLLYQETAYHLLDDLDNPLVTYQMPPMPAVPAY
jgi:hypothetical protein